MVEIPPVFLPGENILDFFEDFFGFFLNFFFSGWMIPVTVQCDFDHGGEECHATQLDT